MPYHDQTIWTSIIAYLLPNLEALALEEDLGSVHTETIVDMYDPNKSSAESIAINKWCEGSPTDALRDTHDDEIYFSGVDRPVSKVTFLLMMGLAVVVYAAGQIKDEYDVSVESVEAVRQVYVFTQEHEGPLGRMGELRLLDVLEKE